MIFTTLNFSFRPCSKMHKLAVFPILLLFFLFSTGQINAQIFPPNSTQSFGAGSDQLIIYSNVPDNHPNGNNNPILKSAPSRYYKIRVKSSATGNVWKTCFTNVTRSLYNLHPSLLKTTKYWEQMEGWTHTYSNIEMGSSATVDVEISIFHESATVDGPLINPNGKFINRTISSATIKPNRNNAIATTITNTATSNTVVFTITKPGQYTIDLNNQMEQVFGDAYTGPPIHTVSLFANPILANRPAFNNGISTTDIEYVQPGTVPSPDFGTEKTLYFLPGVHNIGKGFKLLSNKNYYIPGDAVVYGTFANVGGSGANITMHGYGTISGDLINHPADETPAVSGVDNEKRYRLIYSDNCTNFKVIGLNLMNCPMHTMKVTTPNNVVGVQSVVQWAKVISWRRNGDGLGDAHEITDTFIRTQDDCTYVKGDRQRCVFWTDMNGSIFSMSNMFEAPVKPFYIKDIDVIYARNRNTNLSNNGGRVFAKRSDQGHGGNSTLITPIPVVSVVFDNIDISDAYETRETFQLLTTGPGTTPDPKQPIKTSGGYKDITFKNIKSVKVPLPSDNRITGCTIGHWEDITFENVVLGGKKIESRSDFASMGDGEGNPDFVTVTFIIPTTDVSLSGCQTSSLTVGDTRQLTAAVVPANATNKNVTWTSNMPSVATVSSTGLVTAKSAGQATIKVETADGNFSKTCTITVSNPVTSPNVTVGTWQSGTTISKGIGTNRLLTVVVMGEHATENLSATTVTYGGQVMTKQTQRIQRSGTSPNFTFCTYAAIFTLNEAGINAANNTGTISVTWSTGNLVGSNVYSVMLTNAQQSTILASDKVNNAALSATQISTTALSSPAGSVVLMCGATAANNDVTNSVDFSNPFNSNLDWGASTVGNTTVGNTAKQVTPGFTQVGSAGRMVVCAIVVNKASTTSAKVRASAAPLEKAISIYPNPVSNTLNIDFADSTENKEVQVYNTLGQLLYSAKTKESRTQIDITSLHVKGLVLVKIIDQDGISNHKVVVQ
jgi:uncharacterized protein YjdB